MHISEKLFNATNGGLDILLSLLDPKAQQLAERGQNFCFGPNDRNPSCSLYKNREGVYFLKDFGGDIKGGNAISTYAEDKGIEWQEALIQLATQYGVLDSSKANSWGKAVYKTETPKPDDKPGSYTLKPRPLTEDDFHLLFSRNVIEFCKANPVKDKANKPMAWTKRLIDLCAQFNLKALTSYSFYAKKKGTDEPIVHVFESTDDYPIYAYDMGTWAKTYQPYAQDKKYRFTYLGGKPEGYIFGLEQFRAKFTAFEAAEISAYEENFDSEGNEIEEKKKPKKEVKLSEVILCTGGSDALNVAAFGYNVLWLNSETGKELDLTLFNELEKKAKHVYNLPDLDSTGKREAHNLAVEFLDLRTIELPAELMEYSDNRGGKCKDVKDYFKYYSKNHFDTLLKMALPYRFWDSVIKRNREGEPTGKIDYDANNVQLYNFLMKMGFYQFKGNNGQTDMYIKITGNTVKDIEPKIIRGFVNSFLERRKFNIDLRNVFLRTNQLSSTSMENLGYTELEFKASGKTFQYLFYKDCTIEVNPQGIVMHKPGDVDVYTWEEQVIKRRMYKRLKDKPFTITDAGTQFNIEIHHRDCLFFRFLENSTKMHWKVEKYGVPSYDEHGNEYLRKEYTIEEQREHDEHLINRIFTIGYLMHNHKNPSKPWGVWIQENVVMDDSDSNGGSGKSILANCFKHLYCHLTLGARDPKITENKFLFENVSEKTKIIHLNDCHRYLDFGYFYPMLTDDLSINPKQNRQITMPFSMSPKFIFSSNYTPRDQSQSAKRRLLTTAFSDYYHDGPNDIHTDAVSPRSEFGKNLFDDFTAVEWEYFDTTMAYCLQFYLSLVNTTHKIDPPQNIIRQRALLSEMVNGFHDWAQIFFSDGDGEENNLGKNIPKEELLREFNDYHKGKCAMQSFTKSLKAYCELEELELNPETAPGYNKKSRRIIQQFNGKTTEMVHVAKRTPSTDAPPPPMPPYPQAPPPPPILPNSDDNDDIPF